MGADETSEQAPNARYDLGINAGDRCAPGKGLLKPWKLFGSDTSREGLLDSLDRAVAMPAPPQVPFDDSRYRTADATERAAMHMEAMVEHTQQLVELTRATTALAEASRRDSERSERFARWTSIASLAIAIGSLVVAIVLGTS